VRRPVLPLGGVRRASDGRNFSNIQYFFFLITTRLISRFSLFTFYFFLDEKVNKKSRKKYAARRI
jgi:hypothetical protein